MPGFLATLSQYAVALVAPVAAWVGSIERRLRNHDDRIEIVESRQEGDSENPNDPGVLEQVHGLERDVRQVDAKLERAREERQEEHARVMERLDELESAIDA